MSSLQRVDEEKSVLRWGGLAGILGGISFILYIVISAAVLSAARGPFEQLPNIAAQTVAGSLSLVTLILWVPHFLALYRALRDTSLAPALFGSVLGILGLGVIAASTLPHVAVVPLSDLYHGSRATPADQAALILISQATWGIFDALFFAGLAVEGAGLSTCGAAMLRNPAFGKGFGGLSVILGVFVIVAAVVLQVDPSSLIPAAVSVLALVVFHIVLGWKVYRMSRAS